MLDTLTRLRYAIASTRHGGGASRMAKKARRDGLQAYEQIFDNLTGAQVEEVDETSERLVDQGIDAVLLADDGYPPLLIESRGAPAALFVKGPHEVLLRAGIGICGSRNASGEGLRAARASSGVVTDHGFNLVSGYARGVDMASHAGALEHGGSTTMVLAEGIEHFKVRRGEFTDLWDPSRSVVISQFAPTQPWRAGAAMARNAVISGLSKALVVVEAGETGGTLAAGLHALERGQPVLVLQLPDVPPGNEILLNKGAIPVSSRADLANRLAELPSTGGDTQLSLM
jgi:DNA processing protein